MEIGSSAPRPRGRPRSFDRDAALHRAMLQFWRTGYEGTSLQDLTGVMGVSAPSLYAAFGDKKRLFLAAVERYALVPVAPAALIAASPSALAAAHDLLEGSALAFTGADTPAGCLLASAAASGSAAIADVQAAIAAIRRDIETALRDRIARGIAEGEVAADADADALAGHVMAVVQGLSTLARDGAPREKLLRVVGAALAGWPLTQPPACAMER